MELLQEWSYHDDLSLTEATFLLCGIDPKLYFYRIEVDYCYAEYHCNRGTSEDAAEWIEPLRSGIRAGTIKTTTDTAPSANCSEVFITKASFIDWCVSHNKHELARLLCSTIPGNTRIGSATASDELHRIIHEIAERIALKLWKSGIRQISARSIAPLVAKEIETDERFNGQRGPLEAGTIRTRHLKGWKFMPPKAE